MIKNETFFKTHPCCTEKKKNIKHNGSSMKHQQCAAQLLNAHRVIVNCKNRKVKLNFVGRMEKWGDRKSMNDIKLRRWKKYRFSIMCMIEGMENNINFLCSIKTKNGRK